MSFLNPLFLIALISVGVPLLIYLLNIRKPKKVRFSTLAFFDALKTTSLKRIKIKRWLLLAIRCLAVIMLVLAASRPFLPPLMGFEGGDNQPKSIGILIDNSPSMLQIDANGPYIEQAISTASTVAGLAGNSDRIFLEVTNGEPLFSPGQSVTGANAELNSIEVSNSGNYTVQRIKNLVNRLQDSPEPVNIIYLITDGQTFQFSDFDDLKETYESVAVQLFKVGSNPQNNVAVTKAELANSQNGHREIELDATIQNFGNSDARNYFLSLEEDGELITQQIVNLDAKSEEQYRFTYSSGDSEMTNLTVILEGDEYTFDNRRYVAIQKPEEQRILVVQDDSNRRSFQSYLNPLLEAATDRNSNLAVDYSEMNSTVFNDIKNYDTIVLDGLEEIPGYAVQELIQTIQEGRGLLFLPSANGDISGYNRLFQFAGAGRYTDVVGSYGSFQAVDRMSVLTDGHPVLEEMFEKQEDEQIRINAPEVFYYYAYEDRNSSAEKFEIAGTQTGESLITEYKVGNGIMIIAGIGSDPGWSNFPVKPLFAPLLYRTVLYLTAAENQGLKNHQLGKPFRALLPNNPDQVQLLYKETEILPELQQVYRGTQITHDAQNWEPGWATVVYDEKKLLFAVNQNAMESDFGTLSTQELKDRLKDSFPDLLADQIDGDTESAERQIQSASFGREIWYWFIIAAIVLLLVESVISRSYKAETIQ
jgi:hypothetical protein